MCVLCLWTEQQILIMHLTILNRTTNEYTDTAMTWQRLGLIVIKLVSLSPASTVDWKSRS